MKIRCLFDRMVPVNELKGHPKNRNAHPPEQIKRLAQILEYQGFRYPIKVSKASGFITSGHGRLLAAKELGATEVPVNFQEYESDAQEYADIIADNSIASWSELDLVNIKGDLADLGPDFDLDLLGIKDFVVEAEVIPQCDEDAIPEHLEPRTKLGDIYKLGNHRLMCGDSTSIDAVEKLMDGKKAEALISDPPYGISYQSNHREEKFEVLKNDDVILEEWVGCAEVVVSGWVIFFIGWQRLAEWLRVGSAFGDLTNILVWRKAAAMGDLKGSFSPTYELALAYNRGSKLAPGAGRPSAVIECNIDSGESFLHPTQKPVKLLNTLLEAVPSKSVLDLFGGSGTTLIACEKTGRSAYLMELDPKYCDVIVARWEAFTGKKAELVNG